MIVETRSFGVKEKSSPANYWIAVAILTLANTIALGITSAAAGLSLNSFIEGSREVVFLNMIALTVLLWPAIAVAVRGLRERHDRAWIGVGLHTVTVFVFMFAYFGKPFDVPGLTGSFKALPTVLFMVVAAWLMVETFFMPVRRLAGAGYVGSLLQYRRGILLSCHRQQVATGASGDAGHGRTATSAG